MRNAIRFHEQDNVLIALSALVPNDRVDPADGSPAIAAIESIPMGHKVAAQDIEKGEPIVKYGHAIGIAKETIAAGQYVHVHNVRDLIADWTGHQHYAYDPGALREIDDAFALKDPPKLYGYRRKDGMVGFRNYLAVLSTSVCANQIVRDLGMKYRDIVTIENPSGCVILPNEVARIQAILLGIAKNPNVGAVIFVGLGCESVEAEWFHDQMKAIKPSAFVRVQSLGSTPKAYERLEACALAMKADLDKQTREEVSVADIRLGTKCGASDWTTAAASNPAIGYASDLVVKNGGISLLGETSGWFGGEEALIAQARDRKTADAILALMDEIYDRALLVGQRIEEGNPTPGNIAGGISTLNEKALGNVKKGGTAPIEGALRVGEYPQGHGLYVVDNAGLDPVSLLGLTCSSANLLLFSTGRGTPVGNPVAPAIKLTASPYALELFEAHMDVELTQVVLGDMSLKEAGELLFQELIDVANGKQTIAEQWGHREYAFPLLMGPL